MVPEVQERGPADRDVRQGTHERGPGRLYFSFEIRVTNPDPSGSWLTFYSRRNHERQLEPDSSPRIGCADQTA